MCKKENRTNINGFVQSFVSIKSERKYQFNKKYIIIVIVKVIQNWLIDKEKTG